MENRTKTNNTTQNVSADELLRILPADSRQQAGAQRKRSIAKRAAQQNNVYVRGYTKISCMLDSVVVLWYVIFKPFINVYENKRDRMHQLLLRLAILGLVATSLAYLTYFLTGKANILNRWINSWMNPSFVNFLQNSPWAAKLLIALLVVSLFLKLIALYRVEYRLTVQGEKLHDINSVNSSYNVRDNITISTLLIYFVFFISCGSENIIHRKINATLFSVDLITKKIIVGGIIAICATSLIACFQGLQNNQTLMGFSVVPEFIQNTKWLLIMAAIVLGVLALVFVYYCIVDLFNVFGKTVEWIGFKRMCDVMANNERPVTENDIITMKGDNRCVGDYTVYQKNGVDYINEQIPRLITRLQFPFSIRNLRIDEGFNERIGDKLDRKVGLVVDEIKKFLQELEARTDNMCLSDYNCYVTTFKVK